MSSVGVHFGAIAVIEDFSNRDESNCPGRVVRTKQRNIHMTIRQRLATIAVGSALICAGALAGDVAPAAAAPLPTSAVAAKLDMVATSAAAALAAMGTDRFTARMDEAALAVASRLEVDAGQVQRAWAAADQTHQIALLSALTQVGVPYHRNTSKPGIGFDCSGLTAFAWAQTGIELSRHSSTQLRNAAPRTRETAQAGDLVYYPGHVMLWLGVDNLIVHAPQRGHPVEVGAVSNRRGNRVKFGDPIG